MKNPQFSSNQYETVKMTNSWIGKIVWISARFLGQSHFLCTSLYKNVHDNFIIWLDIRKVYWPKHDYYTTQNKTNFKGTFGIHKTLGPSKAFSSPGFGGISLRNLQIFSKIQYHNNFTYRVDTSNYTGTQYLWCIRGKLAIFKFIHSLKLY